MEERMEISLEKSKVEEGRGLAMYEDNEDNEPQVSARAAPTRKRNYDSWMSDKDEHDSTSTISKTDDEQAGDILKSVTGKRFSITEFFKKRFSTTSKTDDEEAEDVAKTVTDASKRSSATELSSNANSTASKTDDETAADVSENESTKETDKKPE